MAESRLHRAHRGVGHIRGCSGVVVEFPVYPGVWILDSEALSLFEHPVRNAASKASA